MSRAASSDALGSTPLPSRRTGTGALPRRQRGTGDDVPAPTLPPVRGRRQWQSDIAARQAEALATTGARAAPTGALGTSATDTRGRTTVATRAPGPDPARRRRPARGQPVTGREAARLGELSARKLDRRAVVVDRRRIGKLEPGWGFLRRLRSLLILILIVAIVAGAFAALLAVIVEVIGAAANHAISKSAGS